MDISQRARDDLIQLDKHIVRLREQLRQAEGERIKLQMFLEVVEHYDDAAQKEEDAQRDSKSARIRRHAEAAITEAGDAVTIHDIVAFIEEHGEEITGKDKTSYVSAILSRDRRFNFAKDKGWSVLRPLPRPDLLEALERLRMQGAPITETKEADG